MTNRFPVRSIPRKRKPVRKHRVLLSILMVLILIGVMGCIVVAGYVISLAGDLPDITAEDLVNAQTGFVYDENGNQIAELHGGENRVSVPLSQMPDYLVDAVIASEDIRFYKHHGVDYRGVMRAAVVDIVDTIRAGEITFTQGASTITMQLVRNVIDKTEKTLDRKIKEALLALEFEKSYDKDEILYYYLNEIYIGPQVYGMQAASNYYFNKNVEDITISEAALLVGIIRNPGYYSPYSNPDGALLVRNTVLNSMTIYDEEKYGVTAAAAKADPLTVYEADEDSAEYEYPWFVDSVVAEAMDILEDMGLDSASVYTGGLHIYTTLDVNVQTALETAFADDANFPESNTGDIVESGMAIVEPTSGKIKGLVGGRVYTARRGFNRATDLIRSPGSTIKPLVTYGPAVQLGYGAGYVIDDSPVTYGSWSPNNDDRAYLGRITMRTAIARSRNVCAVKMLQLIGPEVGWSYGVKMGLNLTENDAMNLSMTLGGLEEGVSPLQMAGAFATFANAGVHITPYTVTRIVDSHGDTVYETIPELTEVFTPATAYIMTDMMTTGVLSGTGTSAKISGWQTAGKTGTNGLPSNDDPDYRGLSGTKDAWFCGYTSALAGAVWMGYDNKKDEDGNLQYLNNVFGGSYPARLFRTVMTMALENYTDTGFSRPDGVTSMTVDTKTGSSPTDLTPSEFIQSELFPSGSGLMGDGTAWTMVEVCADSATSVQSGNNTVTKNYLAGVYCPNKVSKVALTYETGKMPSEKVADFYLYAPAMTCPIHTTYVTGLLSVSVCLDPAHNGQVYLANVPATGSSGGCPAEYVSTRYYAAGSMPTAYCPLTTHQVVGQSITDVQQGGPSDGGGGGSAGVTATPNTPTGLIAVPSSTGIYLSWDSNNEEGIVFVVGRTREGESSAERFAAYTSECTDGDVSAGTTYSYRVYAYNPTTGEISGWSNAATATME